MKNILRRKTSIVPLLIIMICILGFGTYFVFHMAIVSTTSENTEILKIMTDSMEHMKTNPLGFNWNESIQKNFLEYEKWWLMSFFLLVLVLYASQGIGKSEFHGIEHGSASWATENDLKPFRKPSSTIIGHRLYLQKYDPKKDYNQNRFVIGAPGTGKTFGDVKPNILLAQDNYIVTDIKGEILRDTAYRLTQEGYTIKVLNLISMADSMKFNPLKYIKEEEDVISLTDTFLRNTDNGNTTNEDGFWSKAEKALLQAIIFYIYKELPPEERTLSTCLKLLCINVDFETFDEKKAKNSLQILDSLYKELAERDPSHPAVSNYKIFKLSGGDTTAGILVGLAVRFSLFTVEKIKDLTSDDEMELDKLATEKIAIYCIIPETNRAFDLITAMFFSKLFEHVIWMADNVYNGSLPRRVKFIMDEFRNCGYIPNVDGYLSTVRSRNVSIHPYIQELSQLQEKYKDSWKAIIGCCDTFVFMGSPETETLKYISQKLDKTTVQVNSKSYNFGARGGRTESINYIERDLLKPNEISQLVTPEKQIVFVKATKPIFCDKFKTQKSKLYQYMPDRNNPNDPRRTDYKEIRKKQDLSNGKKEVQYYETIEMVTNGLNEILADLG